MADGYLSIFLLSILFFPDMSVGQEMKKLHGRIVSILQLVLWSSLLKGADLYFWVFFCEMLKTRDFGGKLKKARRHFVQYIYNIHTFLLL